MITKPKTAVYRAFTLIEVMVVVIILGILATIAMPRILDRPEEARRMAAKSQIRSFETALGMFTMDNGRPPTSSEGLEALVSNPGLDNWRDGGYLQHSRVPKDPWGRDYIYRSPGEGGRPYDLISLGRDGERGGSGHDAEIRSWELD